LATRTCIKLVSRVLAHTFEFSIYRSRSSPHNPLPRYHLGRFAGLKHRQLARQVGVIITTERIRRTLVNKINLLVDSLRSIEASRLAPVKAESIFLRREPVALARRAARRQLLRLRRASGCLVTSHGSSHCSSSTTLTTSRVQVPRHVARLVTRLVLPLVVDYSTYVACPGASACRVARHPARRRLLCLAQARPRLLLLRRASGCLGTSRTSSRGSSSTTSTTPRVWQPA
jgi:hypothetical protein